MDLLIPLSDSSKGSTLVALTGALRMQLTQTVWHWLWLALADVSTQVPVYVQALAM